MSLSPIDLQKSLAGVDYPCSRDDIVRTARDNGADSEIIAKLEELPEETYDGPDAVSAAVF